MSTNESIDFSNPCRHVTRELQNKRVERPQKACPECVAMGSRWVHLRICLECGHVGCCDSSPNKHATAHHRATAHPMITSGEGGENWAFCYADDQLLSAE